MGFRPCWETFNREYGRSSWDLVFISGPMCLLKREGMHTWLPPDYAHWPGNVHHSLKNLPYPHFEGKDPDLNAKWTVESTFSSNYGQMGNKSILDVHLHRFVSHVSQQTKKNWPSFSMPLTLLVTVAWRFDSSCWSPNIIHKVRPGTTWQFFSFISLDQFIIIKTMNLF